MTDIPRGPEGDGSPQLDLDAIEARRSMTWQSTGSTLSHGRSFPVGVLLDASERDALVALVRRLQQENDRLHAQLVDCGDKYQARRGRVEELTEALRALLTDAFVDDVFTMEAQLLTAPELKARALLARVVPEKETP